MEESDKGVVASIPLNEDTTLLCRLSFHGMRCRITCGESPGRRVVDCLIANIREQDKKVWIECTDPVVQSQQPETTVMPAMVLN